MLFRSRPPVLPRACWDTLAEPHWPPPALAPAGPQYQGRASTASHFPALLGALLSRSLPGRMEAAVLLSVHCACPSPGARAGPLPPCPAALGHHEEVGGSPAEPRYRPTRAAVFLPFCKRGRATQVAQGSPRGTVVGQGRSGDLLHGGAPSEPSIQPLPRSLAGIRPAASRLVPWPSPPKKAARQPVGGGRVAPRGLCRGAGRGERGFSSGAILTEVGVTPRRAQCIQLA